VPRVVTQELAQLLAASISQNQVSKSTRAGCPPALSSRALPTLSLPPLPSAQLRRHSKKGFRRSPTPGPGSSLHRSLWPRRRAISPMTMSRWLTAASRATASAADARAAPETKVAGTTIISPAIRPRTAAPICWRNQRSSSWGKGWRQVEGIGYALPMLLVGVLRNRSRQRSSKLTCLPRRRKVRTSASVARLSRCS
jgi:hypothetical protein